MEDQHGERQEALCYTLKCDKNMRMLSLQNSAARAACLAFDSQCIQEFFSLLVQPDCHWGSSEVLSSYNI